MKRLPQIALLRDGRRLHLQDGPIDLIVEAKGGECDVRAAYDAAAERFTGLLDELCEELVELRKPADPAQCALNGAVARRMHAAVAPFAADCFITPMAAVAGSVGDSARRSALRVSIACANSAKVRAPTAMSSLGPERYAAAPVVIWTMPSERASLKPRTAAFSVSDELTLTAGYA